MLAVDAPIEQHLGQRGQIFGGGEKPGMGGNSVEEEGVLIVHIAVNQAAVHAAADLGGGDAREQAFRRIIHGVGHLHRPVDHLLGELVDALAGDGLQDLPDHNQAEVGVDHRIARRIIQRQLVDVIQRPRLVFGLVPQIRPPVHPGGVGEEMAHGDALLGPAVEFGQIVLHRDVEREFALLPELHRHGSGGRHFGDRGKVVDGFGIDGRRVRRIGLMPDAPAGQQLPVLHDGDLGPGEDRVGDRLLQHGVGLAEQIVGDVLRQGHRVGFTGQAVADVRMAGD